MDQLQILDNLLSNYDRRSTPTNHLSKIIFLSYVAFYGEACMQQGRIHILPPREAVSDMFK